jgi:hypothetical protein
MEFESTITLGNIINAIVVIGGLLWGGIKLSYRLGAIEAKVFTMWNVFEKRINGRGNRGSSDQRG